ncbi:MAG: cytochrome c [Verrucomicrobiota bacterium]
MSEKMKETTPVQQSDPQRGVDYDESNNVIEIHEQISREQEDPDQGAEPIPLWGIGFVMVVLAVGFMYFGMFSAGFQGDGYDERGGSAASKKDGGAAEELPPEVIMVKNGGRSYKTYCQSCHQATGMGVTGQYPPLVASRWVMENDERLAAIILGGLQGPIEVKGNNYNGNMAAWGGTLSDKKIAEITAFIRQEWGNDGPPVSEDTVAQVRADYHADRIEAWTAAELNEVFNGN